MFPRRLAALASVALLGWGSPQSRAADKKPNLLIILADDQGWGDLGVTGNLNLETPNIDRLAKAGAAFDRFYVCPLCAPTRAEFLTGRYHPRGGVSGVSTGKERLNLDEKTLADAFRGAGYATGCFGKWHNGSQWPYHPNARGFQEFYGFTSGHWGEYFDPPLDHNGEPVRGKGYIADDFAEHAIEFIEANKSRPFLCYLAFNTPHTPFSVPTNYWERFKNKTVAMRARPENQENLAETRCILAMTENLDWNVGRVLRRLDELKLTDNTIVVYFSDNGPNTFRWNGDMKGRKGSTDEGGVRAPCFVRWPGKIKPGAAVHEIAGAIDLLPTLTSMAAVQRVGTKPLDGLDLSPVLLGKTPTPAKRMLFSHQSGAVSVRTDRFRLDAKGELFDMLADPGQRTNVAALHPEVASSLSDSVANWEKDVLAANTPKQRRNRAAGNQGENSADSRPYPVGYAAFPRTPLPARDGVPHGGILRSASAPNCSYFVHWTAPSDFITWDVDVATSGDYQVELQYTCPEKDAGATVELNFGTSKLAGKVVPGWDPPLYTNQDTLPRRAESQMKPFHALNLGAVRLEKGRGLLTLRAVDIPGGTVMDLRQVNLTLIK